MVYFKFNNFEADVSMNGETKMKTINGTITLPTVIRRVHFPRRFINKFKKKIVISSSSKEDRENTMDNRVKGYYDDIPWPCDFD